MFNFTPLGAWVRRHLLLPLATTFLLAVGTTAQAQAPANDNPCAATVLLPNGTLCTAPTTGTNVGATTTNPSGYNNPGGTGCGTAAAPKDVWYTFTTGASGPSSFGVTVTVTGNPAGLLRLFSAASCAGPFTQVACASGTGSNTVSARLITGALLANTTYYIMVAGYTSTDTQGPFTICLTNGPSAPVCQGVSNIQGTFPAGLLPGQGVVSFVPGANNVPPYTVVVASQSGVPARTYVTNASPVTVSGLVPGGSQTVTITSACSFGGSASATGLLTPRTFNSQVCGATPLSVNATCAPVGGNLFNSNSSGTIGCGAASAIDYKCQWYKFTTAASGPASTQATVSLSSQQGANELQVWSGIPCPGNTLSALTLVGCSTNAFQSSTTPPLVLTTLTPSTTYYVQVGASRGSGSPGFFSLCVTAPGGCSAPDLSVGNVGATSAVVNFTPIVNSIAPQSYTITYQAAGGAIQTLSPAATGPAASLTGLLPGTTYSVTVTANCAGSGVAAPATATFTTAATAPACADPASLAINDIGAGTATLAFTPVAGASSYIVTYQAAGSSPQTVTPAPTTSPVVFTGLLPATAYGVTVQAVCPAGVGAAQAISFATPALTSVNDNCATALPLPISSVCRFTLATSLGATASVGVPSPGCAANAGAINDVWFAIAVPANGIVQVTTAPFTGSIVTDTGLALYSGACGSLTLLGCNDDYTGGGDFSQLRLTGQTPGDILYARVWRYAGNGVGGPFYLCATTDATLATASATFSGQVLLYPNPAQRTFTVQVPTALARPTDAARLYNGLGQLVRQQPLAATATGAEARFDVSGLPTGVYVLRLPTATGVVVKRVVVE